MKNKRVGYFFLIILILLFSFASEFEWIYVKSRFVCGRVDSINEGMKGNTYVNYRFNLDGNKYFGSTNVDYINNSISYDSLLKLSCVRIEYSTFFKSVNRINDPRLSN
jgi:hypothetical protein